MATAIISRAIACELTDMRDHPRSAAAPARGPPRGQLHGGCSRRTHSPSPGPIRPYGGQFADAKANRNDVSRQLCSCQPAVAESVARDLSSFETRETGVEDRANAGRARPSP